LVQVEQVRRQKVDLLSVGENSESTPPDDDHHDWNR
jgi:hypothetical protein